MVENKVETKIIKEENLNYNGFSLTEMVVNDGKEDKTKVFANRPGAVGAIVYDTKKQKYIFVEQFRAGAQGVMVEIPAGKIDEGETPEQAVKREIMEETGYKVDNINHVKDFYASPGYSNEVISVFYVEVSERIHEEGLEEGISVVEVEQIGLGGRLFFQDPMNMGMEEGVEQKMMPPYQLIDAKSLIAVMWLEYNNTLKDMSEVITQAKLRSL